MLEAGTKRKNDIKTEDRDPRDPKKKRKEVFDNFTRFPVRARPHSNPLQDSHKNHPLSPDYVPWNEWYPKNDSKRPNVVDVGCAYGGLLCELATRFPEYTMLGMEIRLKVAEYAQDRIKSLRSEKDTHHNIWIIQNNVMKYLPNYITKGSIDKMFFTYPDPHYKKKNYRRRIISKSLLAEYAYALKVGAKLYTCTDVKDLGDWMKKHLLEHPLFEEITGEERDNDEWLPLICDASEDARRTEKQQKAKHFCVFRRIE
mmetsp:Transcript_8511/g.12547  ORF Transcript_8511/g.12547 Transcript_8511/m.12547 type:complete len:257 (-) Transcript_8511:56-826(-)